MVLNVEKDGSLKKNSDNFIALIGHKNDIYSHWMQLRFISIHKICKLWFTYSKLTIKSLSHFEQKFIEALFSKSAGVS